MIRQLIRKLVVGLCGETRAIALSIRLRHRNRIIRLEDHLLESNKKLWEESRKRWRQCRPNSQLTWGLKISGSGFIRKVGSYNVFTPEKSIFEIGVGAGRLLKALLEENASFDSYLGVDISAENVIYLQKIFQTQNIRFIKADIEEVQLPRKFDIVLSSLTFKHLFPSFEKALRNVSKCMNYDAMLFFDLIEGKLKYFEEDGTYIRHYTRFEIAEILRAARFELVTFDDVLHAPGFRRLLVIARYGGIT